MSEFNELIKNFDKIRDYMRDFFVYGFKSREDFSKKSLRSYDNEKRRIESYLADFMSFYQDEDGKNIFISIDSAQISENPLYRAFKAKSFTKNDIALNFFIIDILIENDALSASEITDVISNEYLTYIENPTVFDVYTTRNKLKEYETLGILASNMQGKKLLYSLNKSSINVKNISDALCFFSEVSPVGVVGSYLLDKCEATSKYISFKHHYIMHALESEMVVAILKAIHNKQDVEIINHSPLSNKEIKIRITPLKFLTSVQGGRRYLSAFNRHMNNLVNYRLDYIKKVDILETNEQFDDYYSRLEVILKSTWGVSFGKCKALEKLSLTLYIPAKEEYIKNRIMREGRNGTLSQIDETTYRYEIEVLDTIEMMPWIRTFIGRIIRLECDNKDAVNVFYNDLNSMYNLYAGGEADVI